MKSVVNIKEEINDTGYVVLPSYLPKAFTIEAASKLGRVQHIEGINKKQILIPRSQSEKNLNTYSGNFGLNAFPLHTDLAHWYTPPRYLLLRSLIGTKSVATGVFDATDLIVNFGRNDLRRALVQPRRLIQGRRNLLRLLDTAPNGYDIFRWDLLFLTPVTEFSRYLISQIKEYLTEINEKKISLVAPGDTMIIDNWRIFHSRDAIKKDALNRRVERVYLSEIYSNDNKSN